MGFEVHRIISDNYGNYECKICLQLVDIDCLVTTVCSHVFCSSCLLLWLDKQQTESIPKCPTCNSNLLYSDFERTTTQATSSDGRNNNHNVENRNVTPQSMMVAGRALLVQPLEMCQPLAHRVLRSIQVTCPLQQASSCSWKGDYGELQKHLLSPSAHSGENVTVPSKEGDSEPMDVDSGTRENPKRVVAIATSLKEEANGKFSTKHYREAIDLYSKAYDMLGDNDSSERNQLRAALLSNRAACHQGLNDFEAAVQDASGALALDPAYVKAWLRKSRCLVQLGEFSAALTTINDGLAQCPSSVSSPLAKEQRRVSELQSQYENSKELLSKQEYASAKAELSNLLRETTAPTILLDAAQADLGLGLVDSARRLCLQALRRRPKDESTAAMVQGQCNLLSVSQQDDDSNRLLESDIALLKGAIRLDPDSSTAIVIKQWLKVNTLLRQARDAAFKRKFESAADLYSTCIDTCPLLPPKAPLFSTLHTERAQVLLRLKQYDATLKDVAVVIYHRQDHLSAWLVRFSALHGKGQHELVLEEVSELLQSWGENEPRVRQAWQKADFEVRKEKRPDYYKMLGVPSIASEREIKKAYRVVAKDMHPDRFAGASEAEQLKAQQEFQELSQGLEILSDDFRRKLYDEGYDPEAIKERVEAAERAAHQSNYHGHGHRGYV